MGAFFRPRPFEELYDAETDPHEMNNRLGDPSHIQVLNLLRQVMDDRRAATGDRVPEVRAPDQFDRETGAPLPDCEERRRVRMRMQ